MTPAPTPRPALISHAEMNALMQCTAQPDPPEAPIDIMFADPHPVVIDGLIRTFESHPEFEVKTGVHDGASAWKEVLKFEPHILVMELTLGRKDSLSLLRDLKKERLKTLPVIFTQTHWIGALEAIAEGVKGLVSKSRPKEKLVACIQEVHHGRTWLDDAFPASLITTEDPTLTRSAVLKRLTLRELSVIQLLIRGRSNREIASTFSIAEGTVKVHLKHIYQKLECGGRVDLLSRIRRDVC